MLTQKVYVNGLSLIAPGLIEPDIVGAVLSGKQPWLVEPLVKFHALMLPSNERRRTTAVTNLALKVISPLLKNEQSVDEISTVFASSDGDLAIDDAICQSLARAEKMVSPTQFGNSVHNAAAGYCSIGAALTGPSVSLSAGDGTFAAGLLDGISQVLCGKNTVILVAYDVVAPKPLHVHRPFEHSLALALRLGGAQETTCLASIELSINKNTHAVSRCQNSSLESLRLANPIGAGVPLFEALMRQQTSVIRIPYFANNQLDIQTHPV